jgi:hypothetical protein
MFHGQLSIAQRTEMATGIVGTIPAGTNVAHHPPQQVLFDFANLATSQQPDVVKYNNGPTIYRFNRTMPVRVVQLPLTYRFKGERAVGTAADLVSATPGGLKAGAWADKNKCDELAIGYVNWFCSIAANDNPWFYSFSRPNKQIHTGACKNIYKVGACVAAGAQAQAMCLPSKQTSLH